MPELLSIAKVATMLDVSETTVRTLVRLGHLPPPKHVAGRAARWTARQVEGYVYALENDLLPPVPEGAVKSKTDRAKARQGTPRHNPEET